MFRPLFLCKKYQEKLIDETKWIYIHKRFEDKLFKELFFHPETNITGMLAHRKRVSIISLLLFFEIFLFKLLRL